MSLAVKYLDLHLTSFNRDKVRDIVSGISQAECIKTLEIRVSSNYDCIITGIHFIELVPCLRSLDNLNIDLLSCNDGRLNIDWYTRSNYYNNNTEVLKQMLQYANQLTELISKMRPNLVLFNDNDYNKLLKILKKRTQKIEK